MSMTQLWWTRFGKLHFGWSTMGQRHQNEQCCGQTANTFLASTPISSPRNTETVQIIVTPKTSSSQLRSTSTSMALLNTRAPRAWRRLGFNLSPGDWIAKWSVVCMFLYGRMYWQLMFQWIVRCCIFTHFQLSISSMFRWFMVYLYLTYIIVLYLLWTMVWAVSFDLDKDLHEAIQSALYQVAAPASCAFRSSTNPLNIWERLVWAAWLGWLVGWCCSTQCVPLYEGVLWLGDPTWVERCVALHALIWYMWPENLSWLCFSFECWVLSVPGWTPAMKAYSWSAVDYGPSWSDPLAYATG